ncbi:hypothetical protein, partial [Klebsiella variicola]|uniref:hypothetical protein n=1 Tax=Klebsiella variicola TaxID=244366 RepID=UPI000AF4DABD
FHRFIVEEGQRPAGPKIELDFDVDADDFFKIATEFGDIGAKITRVNERFIIKIKPPKA